MKTESSIFYNFLKTPFIISKDIVYGQAYTCYFVEILDLKLETLEVVFFSLCIFYNTNNFVAGNNVQLMSISKSIFQGTNLTGNGIDLANCNELYISKTAFVGCKYQSLVYGNKLKNLTFQDSEIIKCDCTYIFNIPEKIEANKIYFSNFIESGKYLFSISSPITISYCYFKDLEYVMKCKNTPMGCLSDVKIIGCSAEGTVPKGCIASFNQNQPTQIYIDTFEPDDCDFKNFESYILPTPMPTPTKSPTASVSQSPSPSPTISPEATPSPSVSESPTVSSSPRPTGIGPSESPSESPTATPSFSPSVSASESPSFSPSVSASGSPSCSPSESPNETPVATPEPTPSVSETPEPTPSVSETPWPSDTPSQTPTASGSFSPTPTEIPEMTPPASTIPPPTSTDVPPKKPFPIIYIILIIVIILLIIIIIIIIICCIRKCSDMKQENLLDRGLILKYNTDENSETTSDRSNVLNLQSDSFKDIEGSDDEEQFFSNRPINRNRYINQNNQNDENTSSSTL